LEPDAPPGLSINRVDFMYKENKPVQDYIQNLILMNTAMGEMIRQLEEIIAEEEKNNPSDFS
jgi:hypothetical protein